MSTTSPSLSLELSDRVVALLRTGVPALWGTLVAWLLAQLAGALPAGLAAPLTTALSSDVVVAVIVAVVIAAWYAAWRWLSPHVPDWLVRIVLGSARTPTYAPVSADGVATITSLTGDERTNLGQLAAALDEGDPGRVALERVLTT